MRLTFPSRSLNALWLPLAPISPNIPPPQRDPRFDATHRARLLTCVCTAAHEFPCTSLNPSSPDNQRTTVNHIAISFHHCIFSHAKLERLGNKGRSTPQQAPPFTRDSIIPWGRTDSCSCLLACQHSSSKATPT